MTSTIDNSQWPLASLLVSRKHQVIYTPTAKNANTTLKRMFVRLSGHPQSEEILRGDVHTYLTSNPTGLSLCDYSPEEATQILNDSNYFRFIVLREPLHRAVSGYVEKFIINPTPSGTPGEPGVVIRSVIDWVYENRGETPDYNRSITFEEFVNYLSRNEDRNLDTHFKSQESYFDQQTFDFIGTVERMDLMAKVLKSQFGQKVKMEHRNRVSRRRPFLRRHGQGNLLPAQLRMRRALPHAGELLTDELTEQLKNRFAADLELWEKASP